MKIVLSGYFGFDNAGDEAIVYSVITLLKKQDPEVDITVLSNQPEKTAAQYGVKAVNRWRIKDIIRELRRADWLISGGGSLFQDQTGIKSPVYYGGVIFLAKLFRTKTLVFAQGVGPLASRFSRRVTKTAMNLAQVRTVRDKDSKKLLQELGVKKSVEVIPDPVMAYPVFETQIKENPDAPIVISIREWPKAADLSRKLEGLLIPLLNQGEQLIFLPMHAGSDDTFSQAICESLRSKGFDSQVHVADGALPIDEKVQLIAKSKFVIGMRLHALIFSCVTGRPFLGLSYDPKIDAFAELASQPVLAHVEEPAWNMEEINSKLEDFLNKQDEYQARVDRYREQAYRQVEDSISNSLFVI